MPRKILWWHWWHCEQAGTFRCCATVDCGRRSFEQVCFASLNEQKSIQPEGTPGGPRIIPHSSLAVDSPARCACCPSTQLVTTTHHQLHLLPFPSRRPSSQVNHKTHSHLSTRCFLLNSCARVHSFVPSLTTADSPRLICDTLFSLA